MRPPKAYLSSILNERVLPKFCRGRTVDVGSGSAKYRAAITRYSTSYTTVDNMSSRYQFVDHPVQNPDVICDVLHMPFADHEFDTAICTEVLEHVEDPFQLVAEAARILKPGGHVILSSGWAAAYHCEPKDYWRFSPDAYRLLCDRADLEVIAIHRKGGIFSLLLYFITRTIDLNMPRLRCWKVRLGPLSMAFEKLAERLDGLVPSEDTIGHVVVARKL